jgi:uncharacterized protein YcfL
MLRKKQSKKMLKWGLPFGVALLLAACGDNSNNSVNSPSALASPVATVEASTPVPSASASESPSASPASAAVEVKADYKLYENADKGISVQYPDSWTMQDNVQGAVAAFLSPVEDDKDRFQDNVNIATQDLQGQDINIEQYTELTKQQIPTIITDATIISSESVTVNGSEMQKLVYTGTQGDFKLKWHQIFTIKDGQAYILTYTSEENKYDNYVKEMEEMSETLAIK